MKGFLWILALLALTACGKVEEKIPAPLEPTAAAKGFYCGMALTEHSGPKGQLHVAGEKEVLWFSSVRDAFAYLKNEGATRRIVAFYVNDMGRANWDHPQPGTWIPGREARYLVASDKNGGMGVPEIIPFADPATAQEWQSKHGGRVVSHDEVMRENH
ncbi:MAG: nitrous oxide reductase accessory protein NosL [Magnetococcales bacterium]|nr:nitrous oxide reductase accessory protein NosL [Magnetococcales bacterium]